MKDRKNFFFLLLFFIILFYWKGLFAYFQGDEWFYFSEFLPLTKHWYGIFAAFYKSIVDVNTISGGAHLTPVYNILWFLNNQFFGLHCFPYATLAILAHAVNSFLVFVLVDRVTRKRMVSIIAAAFFALSYVHRQAVTWIMAYIPTEIAVLFFLLSLIFLFKYIKIIHVTQGSRYLKITFIFFLLSLLTKETTTILFIVVPLILFLKRRNLLRGVFLKYYSFITVFYILYRLGIPRLYAWIDQQIGHVSTSSSIDVPLFVFRMFTYPLKVITEVFIPGEWILNWVENLTPLAYPTYGKEKAIRGANFEAFTQGAGSDMVVYLIGVILTMLFFHFITKAWNGKDRSIKDLLVLGFSITVLSAFPLILIAVYAPWWGYVTFIDSRHLYIASVGASMLFAASIYNTSLWIKTKIDSILNRRLSVFLPLGILFSVWAIFQYVLLQDSLDEQLLTAKQRKTVLQKVFEVVPISEQKKIILVESNSAYYAFPAIPPFQTNLGQILMVHYFQQNQLPVEFLTPSANPLTKGDLQGEGYIEMKGKAFGYFMQKKNIFNQIENGVFSANDVYAFFWDGDKGKDIIIDNTKIFREEIAQIFKTKEKLKDWRQYKDDTFGISFFYPPWVQFVEKEVDDIVLAKIIYLKSQDLSVKMEILKVPEGKGFYDVMKTYTDSDGNQLKNIIVKTFKLDPIHRNTVLMADTGSLTKYFIPTHKEVVSFLIERMDNEEEVNIILSSIEFK